MIFFSHFLMTFLNTNIAINLSKIPHKMQSFFCAILVPPVLLAEFQLCSLILKKKTSLYFTNPVYPGLFYKHLCHSLID